MQRLFPDKAFPELSLHCNNFKWKRCSARQEPEKKLGMNCSNSMEPQGNSLSTLGTGRPWFVMASQRLQLPACSDVYQRKSLDEVSSCGFRAW